MNWNLTKKDFTFVMALEPQGCFVALDDARRVGITTTVHFDKIGWIGNVIVEKHYRSKGIGVQLVKEAVRYLSEKSVTTIALYAYQNTVRFYEKIGFKADCDFVRFAGQGKENRETWPSVKAMSERDLKEAIDLDRACMDWNRERLLERILAESSDLCYASREEGKLVGFVMGDWYRQEVGPLICLTDRDEEAIGLLKTVLGKLTNVEVGVGVSDARRRVSDALVQMSFREEFRVTLMHLGKAPLKAGCLVAMESLERG